jgi:magnesium chelatase subunit D
MGGGTLSGFLPFSAVVGQDDAKLALVLAACERSIGGVLLRGDKGSAKTTLARGLAALLPGGAPFVELPIGATEDRVVGTLDLAAALTGGEKRFDPGLLHAADGGVLYVDEINLLPDHLVDVLLDVAASGVNRVEREGVSHSHASRFLLIGSMNPEEGDLRPQLLDRFGLAVTVTTPPERVEALRRRLEFDADPTGVLSRFGALDAAVAGRLAAYRRADLPDEVVEAVASLCVAAGAEGLRADLTICRAAAALGGWEGRPAATLDDVRRVAPMALAHRARRDPFDRSGGEQDRIQNALDQLGQDADPESEPAEDSVSEVAEMDVARLPQPDRRTATVVTGRRAPAEGPRGRVVGERNPDRPISTVAVGATVRRAVSRRRTDPDGPLVDADDVRQAVLQHRRANLIVIAVDASGSMGAAQRMEAAKGVVMALLRDAYQRRDLVSLVAFRGDRAEVLLRPTGSVEVARSRLIELPSGGRTPLAAGLRTALEVVERRRAGGHQPLIVVITDGRATGPSDARDPMSDAAQAAADIARAGVRALVIDVERAGTGGRGVGLGLAAELAGLMKADHVEVEDLSPDRVEAAIRAAALR